MLFGKADGAVQWNRWKFSTLLCVSIMQGGESPGRGSSVAGRGILALAEPLVNGKMAFPKDFSREFLALAASNRHCLLENPAEGTGNYQELENTCIIPSYKTFLTSWQMTGSPGACFQEGLGFSS